MKLRSQIDNKYKWDIPYSNKQQIEHAFQDIQYLTDTLPKYDGKFTNKDMFFEYFNAYNEQEKNINRLHSYIFNMMSVDSSDVEIIRLNQRFSNAISKFDKATSFIEPQIDDLPIDYLQELLLDPRAKDLTTYIQDIIDNKPHKIEENVSKVLSMVNNSFDKSESVYSLITDSEMTFADALDSKGKSHKVDNASYFKLIKSDDKILRKNIYISYFNSYKQFNKTLSELFINDFKQHNDTVSLRKFDSLLDMKLFDLKVPRVIYDNNIKFINENIPLFQDFVKAIKKESGIQDFSLYDLNYQKNYKKKFKIEDCNKILCDALSILGNDYINKVQMKLNDKSIDYMPNQNKYSGAYCFNNYGCKTIILMNWDDSINSISTLAHEMGHCINAEYYNEAQPKEYADCPLFSAEMTSLTNEILLFNYLIKNATNKEKKIHIQRLFNLMRSNMFSATLESEFELFCHSAIENDTPISYLDLNNKYEELVKKYYGNSIKTLPVTKYAWTIRLHYFTPYYLFAYSTGLITAINIVCNILEDASFTDKYIQFLKNGTRKPAVELLKEIGIDLTTEIPFKKAFKFIQDQLNIYKSLK